MREIAESSAESSAHKSQNLIKKRENVECLVLVIFY